MPVGTAIVEPGCLRRREGCAVDAVHIARVRVVQEKRPNRRAYIGNFPDPIRYGVNTGVNGKACGSLRDR